MKKSILSLASIALVYSTLTFGRSNSQDFKVENATLETALQSEKTPKSEVPRDRLIFSTMKKSASFSTRELVETYKKDIGTAKPDYLTNLKNMWFVLLNPRIILEGTEDEKLFLIHEQLNVDNNLAYIKDFYNLLISVKNIDKVEKEKIANSYFDKNLKVIESVEWSNPEEKKSKETELVYAKRTFFLLLNNAK